jgi:hypothetical protein
MTQPRKIPLHLRHALAVLLAVVPLAAVAATPPCQPRYPTPQATAAMFDMASSTAEMLDALPDARVVVLARGGQDLSRYGLKPSHLAFAMRDDDGIWRVGHLLNRCKSDASQLYVEGLRNFVGESATSSDLRCRRPDTRGPAAPASAIERLWRARASPA